MTNSSIKSFINTVAILVLVCALLFQNGALAQPAIASSVIQSFVNTKIVEIAPLSTGDVLVISVVNGTSTFGTIGNGQTALSLSRLRPQAGQTATASSTIQAQVVLQFSTSGAGDIKPTSLRVDRVNPDLAWLSGFATSGGPSLQLTYNSIAWSSPAVTPGSSMSFLVQVDTTSLSITKGPYFFSNFSVDSFVFGVGMDTLLLNGRLFGNTSINSWPIYRQNTTDGIAVSLFASNMTVFAVVQAYCTTPGIVEMPQSIWGPLSPGRVDARLFVGTSQTCSAMYVAEHSTPGVLVNLWNWPCAYQRCPYAMQLSASTGKRVANYDNKGVPNYWMRHFDPVDTPFGDLTAMSATGNGYVVAAANIYDSAGVLYSRWRKADYDMKNFAYQYGWKSDFYEYPIQAVRVALFGTSLVGVGQWSRQTAIGTALPFGPCDLAFLNVLDTDGSKVTVTHFGGAGICFSVSTMAQASATSMFVAIELNATSSYTFPSSNVFVNNTNMGVSTALLLFDSTPPPPGTVIPPPQQVLSSCGVSTCSSNGDCIGPGSSCVCFGYYGIDCSCPSPVLSATSTCINGTETVSGDVVLNSTNKVTILPGATIVVNGTITFSNSSLTVVLNGSSTGQLIVDGCVNLSGELILQTSEPIESGSNVTIIRAQCITSTFTGVTVESPTQPCLRGTQNIDSTSLSVVFTVEETCVNGVVTGGVPWYAIAVPIIVAVGVAVAVGFIGYKFRMRNEARNTRKLRSLRSPRPTTSE